MTIEIPSFEEMQEMMSKVDRSYRVDNVTFCSDRGKYPERPEEANFWFNHLDFTGDVYVLKDGIMVASMKHRPEVSGREAFDHQLTLFEKYLNAKAIRSDSNSMPGEFYVSLEKALSELRTYGHENGANRLTFVFDQPNARTGETSLFKIHTSKFKPYSRVEGDRRISGYEADPISPLEIIE